MKSSKTTERYAMVAAPKLLAARESLNNTWQQTRENVQKLSAAATTSENKASYFAVKK
jgi:hypothetical protein